MLVKVLDIESILKMQTYSVGREEISIIYSRFRVLIKAIEVKPYYLTILLPNKLISLTLIPTWAV
jgi:hypothetical protein